MIKFPTAYRRLLAVLLAAGITSCSQYSTVKQLRPKFQPVTLVGVGIAKALTHDHKAPLVALGEYVEAIQSSTIQLRKNPSDANAKSDYNFALSRLIGTLSDSKLDPWTQPLRLPHQAEVSLY